MIHPGTPHHRNACCKSCGSGDRSTDATPHTAAPCNTLIRAFHFTGTLCSNQLVSCPKSSVNIIRAGSRVASYHTLSHCTTTTTTTAAAATASSGNTTHPSLRLQSHSYPDRCRRPSLGPHWLCSQTTTASAWPSSRCSPSAYLPPATLTRFPPNISSAPTQWLLPLPVPGFDLCSPKYFPPRQPCRVATCTLPYAVSKRLRITPLDLVGVLLCPF